MFHFANPKFLFLFILLIPLLVLYIRKERQKQGSIQFSSLKLLEGIEIPLTVQLRHLVLFLRFMVISLVILALARPQSGVSNEDVTTEGIDIVMVLDISGSMQALDFKPKDRLHVAKEAGKEFIEKRKNDRLGLVVFAGEAFTQCPLTIDHAVLIELMDEVQIGMIEDGTAIGTAIATAVNRLRESTAKSKVIILLTDGDNNAGKIDPLTAAEIAKTLEIKIYTIGVGKGGKVPFPARDMFGRETIDYVEIPINEALLQDIAAKTGGEFFRATDKQQLEAIYQKIDELEKTKIETHTYVRYSEMVHWFLLPAIFLLVLEILLANTLFRKIP
ncbi:MAG: VWA domain-containing protein [Gemmatimonadetes bacterium]|nr:MAG: VWA domain-containing protein [Gemmatimonadota bacterium]